MAEGPTDADVDSRDWRRVPARESEPLPKEAPPTRIAAEEDRSHEYGARTDARDNGSESPEPAPTPRRADPATPPPQHRDVAPAAPERSRGSSRTPEPAEKPVPEAPNPYDAALALGACLPDGEKVDRETLLADAARELGHPTLTKKVRRAFNKALNVEHNAGRLKTDWEKVWRPKKR
jgi:hypothetical protein